MISQSAPGRLPRHFFVHLFFFFLVLVASCFAAVVTYIRPHRLLCFACRHFSGAAAPAAGFQLAPVLTSDFASAAWRRGRETYVQLAAFPMFLCARRERRLRHSLVVVAYGGCRCDVLPGTPLCARSRTICTLCIPRRRFAGAHCIYTIPAGRTVTDHFRRNRLCRHVRG